MSRMADNAIRDGWHRSLPRCETIIRDGDNESRRRRDTARKLRVVSFVFAGRKQAMSMRNVIPFD